jgi:hypothetical protein
VRGRKKEKIRTRRDVILYKERNRKEKIKL